MSPIDSLDAPGPGPRPISRPYSRLLVTASAGLVALGAAVAAATAGRDSPSHDPAQNAWPVHLVVTAIAAIALAAAIARFLRTRGRLSLARALGAPWRRATAEQIAATFRLCRSDSLASRCAGVLRAAFVAFAVFAAAYGLFRFGMQLGYVGRPAEYVNAWGGPSYVGAMYAHVLDMLVVILPLGALARAVAAPARAVI